MAKVLLKIGYETYLLPDDKGVMAVVKAMSRAVCVHDRRFSKKGIEVRDRESLPVEVSYVGSDVKIHWPKKGESEREQAEEAYEQLCLEEPKSIIIPPSKP